MGQLWNLQINQIPAWDSSLGQSAKETKITEIHPFNHCPLGLPGGSDGKESICKAEDLGLIPGLGRSPGGGHSNPLQCFCLESPMDRGTWRATVHGVQRITISWGSDFSLKEGSED